MSGLSKIISYAVNDFRGVQNAYKVGSRCGRIRHLSGVFVGLKSVHKKVGTIPTAGAIVGTGLPFPGGTIAGYVGGKGLERLIALVGKIFKK